MPSILHSRRSYNAWKSTTFVVVTYTNVPVKDLTSSASFSMREPSPIRTRWPRNLHFSLFKRSSWGSCAPTLRRSASARERVCPFYGMDCQEGSVSVMSSHSFPFLDPVIIQIGRSGDLTLDCRFSVNDYDPPVRELLDSGVGLRYARNG